MLTHQLNMADVRMNHEWIKYGTYKSSAKKIDLMPNASIDRYIKRTFENN